LLAGAADTLAPPDLFPDHRPRPIGSHMTSTLDIDPSPTVHDPIHGVANAFERDGENLWVHCWFDPDAHLPEHYHPTLEEHWEALEGTIQLKLDRQWRSLSVEDGPVRVARGVRHEVRNPGGRPARARAKVLPAGQLEEFLTEAARAAQRGVFTAGGLPTSLRNAIWVATFAQRHRHETVMCSPPPVLQRLVLPILARLAR
jgi:mannose-6-phosphate isomerase-like protein (cupin superfamily)